MQLGLVGKPSAGKSTFFKASTLVDVPIASYPFTTIEPNRGVGYVRVPCPEEEFDTECEPNAGFCEDGTRYVPVKMLDVAGLVPGAYKGKGMGNQFLSDLNRVDVLIHVVDTSGTTDAKGEPTEDHDPAEDIRFLEEELDQWYTELLQEEWEALVRTSEQEGEKPEEVIAEKMEGLRVDMEMVRDALNRIDTSSMREMSDGDVEQLAEELRKRSKPVLVACNKMDMEAARENFSRLQEEFPDNELVACTADTELALREASKEGLIEYSPGDEGFEITGNPTEEQAAGLERIEDILEELGTTGVQEVLETAVFDFLGYIAVYPVRDSLQDSEGNTLPDCFLVPEGTTAQELAYEIHTDLGESFLHAKDVKEGRRMGKDQELEGGDVIEIVTS